MIEKKRKRTHTRIGARHTGFIVLAFQFISNAVALALAATLFISLAGLPARADDKGALLAAASSLRTVWPSLAKAYVRDTANPAPNVSFGSSGLLATQILHGAPFELFLSADQENIDRLNADSLFAPAKVFALGDLQLAVLREHPMANELSLTRLSAELRKANVGSHLRIAIPNPVHAPYGKAARSVLEHAGQWPLPAGRLMRAENASQTLQFLQSGSVDVALLPGVLIRAQALNNTLVAIDVPVEAYRPVEHMVAVLHHSGAQARLFAQWLHSTVARNVLENAGFQLPPSDGKPDDES